MSAFASSSVKRRKVASECSRTSAGPPIFLSSRHPLPPRDFTFVLGESSSLADGAGRRDHVPQFALRLLDATRLEATVRVDVELRGREDREGLLNPLPDQGFRFDHVAMDVHDAEGNLLLERLPLETLQQVEPGIRHLEIELVHGKLVEVVENLVVIAVAGVQDRLRLEAFRHDAYGLHEERQLIETGGEGGFVDLDDLGPRGLEG